MSARLLPRSIAWLRSPNLAAVGVAVLALALASGCKKSEGNGDAPAASQAASAPDPTPPAPTYKIGDAVDVKWNSSWWRAEVLSVNGGTYRIHYVGWSSSWDEDVTPDRVRARTEESSVGTEEPAAGAAPSASAAPEEQPAQAASAAPKKAAAGAWKVGDKVDVNWNGQWWQGQILSVNGNQYKVHYIGWASSWDETVTASRLRPASPGTKRGSGS